MSIPTLVVDGVNYGEPTAPFVVIWSGPVDATEFASQQAAEKEIEWQQSVGNPNAFQTRIFRLNEDKSDWIPA